MCFPSCFLAGLASFITCKSGRTSLAECRRGGALRARRSPDGMCFTVKQLGKASGVWIAPGSVGVGALGAVRGRWGELCLEGTHG